jgi:hypothetical protein
MHANDLDRERYRRLFPDPARATLAVAGAPAFVGRVTTATPVVNKFMLVTPTVVLGAETEGGGGTIADVAGSVPVLPLGPVAPALNDYVVCRFVGHRWVCEKCGAPAGPTPVSLPGCPCTDIPRTLYLHVERQPRPGVESVLFPSDITYGARPSDLSLYTGTHNPGWFSTGKFQSSDFFYIFRYYFTCESGLYKLYLVITPDSPLGYPGASALAEALVGIPGNTCSPFSLHALSTASPTYAAQGVTIDGAAPPPPRAFTSSVVVPPVTPGSPVFRSRR